MEFGRMKLQLVPKVRGADTNKTARQYLDFKVNGRSILAMLGWDDADLITPLGWGTREAEKRAIDELLVKEIPTLPSGRALVYVCAECGDIGCGAIAVRVERTGDQITWSGFAYENGYEEARDIAAEAIHFEAQEYSAIFETIKRE